MDKYRRNRSSNLPFIRTVREFHRHRSLLLSTVNPRCSGQSVAFELLNPVVPFLRAEKKTMRCSFPNNKPERQQKGIKKAFFSSPISLTHQLLFFSPTFLLLPILSKPLISSPALTVNLTPQHALQNLCIGTPCHLNFHLRQRSRNMLLWKSDLHLWRICDWLC